MGFKISGIYPVDINAILSGWSGWSLCSKETAEDVIRLLPTLTEIVQVNGRVTDGEIKACMGHLLKFDAESRKLDDCAMNHGRCLWTNNDNIIAMYKTKQEAEIQKKLDKENRAVQKKLVLQLPDDAEPVEKKKESTHQYHYD